MHTYSSLNSEFIKEYKGALDSADKAIVFYSPKAIAIKGLEKISEAQIKKAFNRDDLIIFTEPQEFKDYLFSQKLYDKVLLLMSSGNYGGLDFNEVKKLLN